MNKKKKAVVLLVPGFPANENDTTCIPPLQKFCLSFSRICPDIELVVISFQYPFKKQSYTWNRIKVYSLGGRDSKYNRLFIWLAVFMRFLKIRQTYDVSVINSFWATECAFVGQFISCLFNIKHVVYVSGQDALKSNRYLPLLNFSKMELIAMSESLAKHFESSTGFKIKHVIPMGVDESMLTSVQINRDVDILGVGALIPLKNYSLFIEIVTELKNHFPNIKACIIGKGEQEVSLKEKIKDQLLGDNLQLLGELSHPEVFSFMQRSKILLHTSSYEGQSTVITEALANGLSVICFDVGRLPSDAKVWVCSTKQEMLNRLKELLSMPLSYEPVIPYISDDTVREFLKIYDIRDNDETYSSDLFYDEVAVVYDKQLASNRNNGKIRKGIANYFLNQVKGKHVLDFGGGTGADIAWLKANNFDIWFCEPSSAMRNIAMSDNIKEGVNFLIDSQTDFRNWDKDTFPQKIDAILSNFAAINSIDNLPLLFSKLDDIMASGGHIIITLLDTTFWGVLKYYLRGFVGAFIKKKYPVYITRYNGREHVAYLHTPGKVRYAMPVNFSCLKVKSLKGSGFMLVHYKKNMDVK